MRNLKKLTLIASAAVLALGLSACGKSDYNGSYTGYQVPVAPAANAQVPNGQNPYPQNQYQPAPYVNANMSPTDIVQANLTSNGDTVTGTYNLSNSNPYGMNQNMGASNSYQFTASSQDSNTLSNVMLVGANCTRRGTLASSNSGKSLTGRLTSLNPGYSNYGCQDVDVTLTRTN